LSQQGPPSGKKQLENDRPINRQFHPLSALANRFLRCRVIHRAAIVASRCSTIPIEAIGGSEC
jgi:hypothetical protein